MPLAPATQQMVIAAYGRLAAGNPLATGDTSFWRQFNLPGWRQRTLVIRRAQALLEGALQAQQTGYQGPLSDMYAGLGYGQSGPCCGPAQTFEATVKARAIFFDPRPTARYPHGRYVGREYSQTFPWGVTMADVQEDYAVWYETMAATYGLTEVDRGLTDPLIY